MYSSLVWQETRQFYQELVATLIAALRGGTAAATVAVAVDKLKARNSVEA